MKSEKAGKTTGKTTSKVKKDPVSSASDPSLYSYRAEEILEISANDFLAIRNFIYDEAEKRPAYVDRPGMEMRSHDSLNFDRIKKKIDRVHAENVSKGKATLRSTILKEIDANLIRINKDYVPGSILED